MLLHLYGILFDIRSYLAAKNVSHFGADNSGEIPVMLLFIKYD